jgi:hypothetical protein
LKLSPSDFKFGFLDNYDNWKIHSNSKCLLIDSQPKTYSVYNNRENKIWIYDISNPQHKRYCYTIYEKFTYYENIHIMNLNKYKFVIT